MQARKNTTIQKWGNSAAVRLPADVLVHAGVTLGTLIEHKVVSQGILLIKKSAIVVPTLDEMLQNLRPAHVPAELEWGDDVGQEKVVWRTKKLNR